MKRKLEGRSVQISGSASVSTTPKTLAFAHEVVRRVSTALLEQGATLITVIGDEPHCKATISSRQSIIFYWSLIGAVSDYSSSHGLRPMRNGLVRIVCSEKSVQQIPANRRELWSKLVREGIVILNFVPPGWNSNSIKRRIQEHYGDALVVVGGGAGAEESAQLYLSHGKLVLPLDIPLGASCEDGTGGAPEMLRWARTNTSAFFPNVRPQAIPRMILLDYRKSKTSPRSYAHAIAEFLSSSIRPQVFIGRLADRTSGQYNAVERFISRVVEPSLDELGYVTRQVAGTASIRGPLLDLAIFREMNLSPYSIIDITSLRPNCLIELGYLLGSAKRTMVTAMRGTKLPFDVKALPCFFWPDSRNFDKLRKDFTKAWLMAMDNPSLAEIGEDYAGVRRHNR